MKKKMGPHTWIDRDPVGKANLHFGGCAGVGHNAPWGPDNPRACLMERGCTCQCHTNPNAKANNVGRKIR